MGRRNARIGRHLIGIAFVLLGLFALALRFAFGGPHGFREWLVTACAISTLAWLIRVQWKNLLKKRDPAGDSR